MADRANRTYYLVVISLFICLLLSFAVYYLTENALNEPSGVSETCYDGTVIYGEDPMARFLRSVYQNETSITRVRNYDYRLFGIVNHKNVVAGRNGFLFEIKDEATDYDYLKDYLGKAAFTEAESAAILTELNRRKDTARDAGAEYLLVIIPNAQSVYGENMPAYFGLINRETRLSRLGSYLSANGFTSYLDMTDSLKAHKDLGVLYNNTENSLNARGVYITYRTVYDRFSPEIRENTMPVTRETLSFREHHTEGKAIAKQAGIESTALNNTVSLSNDTPFLYKYKHNSGGLTTTTLKPAVAQGQSVSLLLQFTHNWEKLQSEPFYSNTFYKVTYQHGLEYDEEVFEKATASVVIQFIYEYELDMLLSAEPTS